MGWETLSTRVASDDEIVKAVERIAEEKKTTKSTVLRWALMDYLTPKLSPISIAALTQVAKDQGLHDLDAAVEYLVRNGGN